MSELVVIGRNLSPRDRSVFADTIREAFSKDLSIDDSGPDDVFFFLREQADVVAVSRYIKIIGITIGSKTWPTPVWGRSLVAVPPEFRGRGFGKDITEYMVNYGKGRFESQIGIHGKTARVGQNAGGGRPSLSDFYRSCGLEVDEEIGSKLLVPNGDGTFRNLSHANISHLAGDPFIAAVKATSESVILPRSW